MTGLIWRKVAIKHKSKGMMQVMVGKAKRKQNYADRLSGIRPIAVVPEHVVVAVSPAEDAGRPTVERLRHAGSDYAVGGAQRGDRIYMFQDSVLERMRRRAAIDPVGYAALMKYQHHWHHGGLRAPVGSVDLNRIMAADPAMSSGMARSEQQAHHRDLYRKARAVLDRCTLQLSGECAKQVTGHQIGIVVDNVVCFDQSLDVAGYAIGYDSPYRARTAAGEVVRYAGTVLARDWGIG